MWIETLVNVPKTSFLPTCDVRNLPNDESLFHPPPHNHHPRLARYEATCSTVCVTHHTPCSRPRYSLMSNSHSNEKIYFCTNSNIWIVSTYFFVFQSQWKDAWFLFLWTCEQQYSVQSNNSDSILQNEVKTFTWQESFYQQKQSVAIFQSNQIQNFWRLVCW